MKTTTDSQLQAAVAAIVKRERSTPRKAEAPAVAKLSKLRRKHGRQLERALAEAGVVTDDMKRLHLDYRAAANDLIAFRSRAGAGAEAAKHRDAFLANRKRALGHVAGKLFAVTPIVLDKPLSILFQPSGMYVEDRIASFDSWAKFFHEDAADTGYRELAVKFFFSWQNPSDYVAVINVRADLLVRGLCLANAVGSTWTGGDALVNLWSSLRIHAPGGAIGNRQTKALATVQADCWPGIFASAGDVQSVLLDEATSLEFAYLLVDPGQLLVIEVALTGDYAIDDGGVQLAFSNDYRVTCPGVVVELLTAPTVTGAGAAAVSPLE
jgi:hypothetical protein